MLCTLKNKRSRGRSCIIFLAFVPIVQDSIQKVKTISNPVKIKSRTPAPISYNGMY